MSAPHRASSGPRREVRGGPTLEIRELAPASPGSEAVNRTPFAPAHPQTLTCRHIILDSARGGPLRSSRLPGRSLWRCGGIWGRTVCRGVLDRHRAHYISDARAVKKEMPRTAGRGRQRSAVALPGRGSGRRTVLRSVLLERALDLLGQIRIWIPVGDQIAQVLVRFDVVKP